MTRMSKQGERRAVCPKRPRPPSIKTGPKKDNLTAGHRVHTNAAQPSLEAAPNRFIPKIV